MTSLTHARACTENVDALLNFENIEDYIATCESYHIYDEPIKLYNAITCLRKVVTFIKICLIDSHNDPIRYQLLRAWQRRAEQQISLLKDTIEQRQNPTAFNDEALDVALQGKDNNSPLNSYDYDK